MRCSTLVLLVSCGALPLLVHCSEDSPPGSFDPDPDSGSIDAASPFDSSVPEDSGARGDASDGGELAPDPSLLVHYAFDDGAGSTATDSSSKGKDGTLQGAVTWTDGRKGKAVSLATATPATAFVSLPAGVLTGVANATFASWVKLKSDPAFARVWDFGNGLAGADNRFYFFTPNALAQGVRFTAYRGAVDQEALIPTGTHLPIEVWKHLAVTVANGDYRVFVDGFPAGEALGSVVFPPSENEPIVNNGWLGKGRFDADPGFDGAIDDFRIYDRVLSDTEIADLAWPKNDYSYWRFDEGAGNTTVDSSDRAIPTVLMNSVGWADGRAGKAIDLAGGASDTAGQHAVMAADPLAGCTTEVTIGVWFKARTLTNWSRLFDFGAGTARFVFLAPTDGAGIHFGMTAAAGNFDMVRSQAITLDQWHHVAVVVSADSSATLYFDGTSLGTQIPDDGATNKRVPVSSLSPLTENWLGKSRFPDPYFDGSIDELRVSCRAYTAGEIENLAHRAR